MNKEQFEKTPTKLVSEIRDYVKLGSQADACVNFINEILKDEPIRLYFLWRAKEEPQESKRDTAFGEIHITIVTAKYFYEFVFDERVLRYDVILANDLVRMEEKRYQETSIEGKPIPVTEAEINYRYQMITQAYLVKGNKAAELSSFLAALRKLIVG